MINKKPCLPTHFDQDGHVSLKSGISAMIPGRTPASVTFSMASTREMACSFYLGVAHRHGHEFQALQRFESRDFCSRALSRDHMVSFGTKKTTSLTPICVTGIRLSVATPNAATARAFRVSTTAHARGLRRRRSSVACQIQETPSISKSTTSRAT